MHETFYAPKGCWKTIYANFPPRRFGKLMGPGSVKPDGIHSCGICQAQVAVEEKFDGIKLENTLMPNRKHSTMSHRMGREKDDGA